MTSTISKKNNTKKPVVALLCHTSWVKEQLDQESWRHNRNVARKIVTSLTELEIKALPGEVRQQLVHSLKSGRITDADSKAIKKVLSSEIVEREYQQRIVVKGSKGFIESTITHLSTLSHVPLGQMLFKSLFKSGMQITIIATDRVSEAPPDNFKDAIPRGKQLKWQGLCGKEVTIKGTGKGSNTTIKYNPAFIYSSGRPGHRKYPPEIALAHELIHADDSAYGRLDPEEVNGVRNYERQAVGLSPYEDKEFTENKFRATWLPPMPPRTQY